MGDGRVTRASDPDRRERIIAAARELIAAEGVDGVSHRKVAALAKVPLGSMTYHFTGRDELIFEVFTRFAQEMSDRFQAALSAAVSREEAVGIVANLINNDVLTDPDELVLTHELYALAARDPKYREVTHAWMSRSRAAFERHFDPLTARLIDALVEGLSIHRALDVDPELAGLSSEERRGLATEALRRLVG
ncbi:TetR/AcrR family transcriptional regulator [Populibacterium corticicola]|uniref:TetR/AcrR family transcriptional regulator n=1 Tax=Populibacterium corticicola TaxID=1812826 RepID=UPI00366EA6E3